MADPMRGDKKPPAANFATTSSSASSTVAATNFEYDNENEWDVGIGDLIIDLDADIEKTTSTTLPPSLSSSLKQSASPLVHQVPSVGSPLKPSQAGAATGLLHPNTMAVEHSATVDKGLKMKIKRTQKPSGNKQHEIVKSGGGSSSGPSSAVFNSNAASKDRTGSVENGSDSSSTTGSNSSQGMSQNKKQAASSGPTAVPSHRKGDKKSSLPPSSTPTPYHPPSHCDELLVAGANTPGPPLHPTPGTLASSSTGIQLNNNSSTSSSNSNSSLSSSGLSLSELHDIRHKQIKTEQKETADVCIGTSVGTITEPECLGPCEPGTSVTLEGIVWHETEGVLVVNVTWRGKTYVGTLLDCTRHDWAPPRFCDSPTSDLDARTTKNSSGAGGAGGGRSSKRGRSSAGANTLGAPGGGGNGGLSGGFGSGDSSFTETRSAKLRNNSGSSSGKDGRDGNSSNGNSSNGTGKDAKSQRRTTNNSNSTGISTGNSGTSSPTPFLPPRPDKRKASKDEASSNSRDSSGNGPNSDTSTKKARNGSPPPTPVLLECPDPNCSKKYKHINGLRYHQNHAHGGVGSTDEDGNSSSSAAPSGETETESTDAEVTDVTADGGDTSLRLPGDSTAPQAGGSQPASTQNSTGPPNSGSGPPPANSQASPGFKIKSPASLLTDVHSLDSSSNQMDTSPHNKKKRKLDEEGDELKTHSAGTPGTQTSLDSSTGIQTTGPIPTEPSSPAYSDISDDETRGPQATRFPPTEGLPPGAPYPPYPVAGGPTIAGQTGLPPGANPSSGQDKHDLHKDLLKPGGPNSWNPADPQSVGTQPPTGLSHPISYYPYSLSGGYPYGQVPPGTPGGPSLPPVGPPGAAPPSQPPGGSLPSLGHDKAGPDGPNAADKGGNENHQILKESHEVKTQVLLPGTYQRPGPQDGPGNRFYLYNSPAADNLPGGPNSRPRVKQDPSPHPSPTSGKTVLGLKDIKKERDSEDVKQEGVKPTMETQGPPPAPTSQPYAYIHTGYHLAPGPPYQYGGPDGAAHPPGPPHPMYRGGPLGVLPPHHLLSMHIHPHARYPPSHGPEDLSTPNSEQKGLDMYYQAASQQHKIHELQERALKSPNNAPAGKPHGPQSGPGTPGSNRGPSPASGPGERGPPNSASGPGSTGPAGGGSAPGTPQGKETSGGRRSSSPPPQRHVHTHHHTHVGLGYSILAGQYPAPYGAAAVQAVINQYPPTTK